MLRSGQRPRRLRRRLRTSEAASVRRPGVARSLPSTTPSSSTRTRTRMNRARAAGNALPGMLDAWR